MAKVLIHGDWLENDWLAGRATPRQKGVPVRWVDWERITKHWVWAEWMTPLVSNLVRYSRLRDVAWTVYGPKEQVERLADLGPQQDKYDVESEEMANGMMFLKVVLK